MEASKKAAEYNRTFVKSVLCLALSHSRAHALSATSAALQHVPESYKPNLEELQRRIEADVLGGETADDRSDPACPICLKPVPSTLRWLDGFDALQDNCLTDWLLQRDGEVWGHLRGRQSGVSCAECGPKVSPLCAHEDLLKGFTCIAHYEPSVQCPCYVTVGEKTAPATHNAGPFVSNEARHFIYRTFLESLPNSRFPMKTPAPPVPQYVRMKGRKRSHENGQWSDSVGGTVLGVLRDPLSVQVSLGELQNVPEKRLHLQLKGALVGDGLPVPIHISLKSLKHQILVDARLPDGLRPSEEILFPFIHLPIFKACPGIESDMFPSYEDHPYWSTKKKHSGGGQA